MPIDTAVQQPDAEPRTVPVADSYEAAGRASVPQSTARRAWGTTWRILVAALVGFIAFGASLEVPPHWAVSLLDFALGIVAIGLLPWRRSAPLLVTLLICLCSGFSILAVGAFGIAVISLATRRRWREITAAGLVTGAAAVAADVLLPLQPVGLAAEPEPWWLLALVMLGVYGALVVIGLYIGGRRELFATLRDRAETAEREQAARIEAARVTERTRIAREMHDVLAHRISLVAMHSGALTYRSDLTRAETAETATVIRENAHLALTELREVLGVLHGTVGSAAVPDRPQPTLAGLAELVAETTAAGSPVTCDVSSELAALLPELAAQASRNAFRILQEALTNARKHAPGTPVRVEIGGAPGGRLTLTIRNAVPDVDRARGQEQQLPGAGMGLTGLVERARLAGGALSHGVDGCGEFVVRGWVPWPA